MTLNLAVAEMMLPQVKLWREKAMAIWQRGREFTFSSGVLRGASGILSERLRICRMLARSVAWLQPIGHATLRRWTAYRRPQNIPLWLWRSLRRGPRLWDIQIQS